MNDRARTRWRFLWVPLGVSLAAMTLVCGCRPKRQGADPGALQGTRHLTVAPFHTQSGELRKLSAALAESLATRLTRLPGLEAAVNGLSLVSPEFRVQGDLTVREGRLVVTARLYGSEGSQPLWSATFWRGDSLDTALVSDLAQGLAEAVYGYLARGSTSTTRGKP